MYLTVPSILTPSHPGASSRPSQQKPSADDGFEFSEVEGEGAKLGASDKAVASWLGTADPPPLPYVT